ncbi:mucK [Symbiodinium sp. CCMP2456]|nr:mucK [Symbiodinium sp. CCMP2456]
MQAAMTVERPSDVMQWFESVPHLLTEQEWEVCERAGLSSLSHCHCPWGGHLLKLTLSGIQVQNADTSKLLLRPETRAMHETLGGRIELLEQLAPGDAVVRQPASWGLLQLANLVFGSTEDSGAGLSEVSVPIVSRQTLCRAWPTNEDTTLMFSRNDGDPADALLICRPQAAEQVGLVGIFAVSAEKFDQWMSTHHALWLDTVLRAATQFLNRPGITNLRALDENMYTVLGLHSCKRGPPLLPLAPGSTEPAFVTIKTDERSQLGEWRRIPLGPDGKFRLVNFVKQFAANLGLRLKAHNSLDGQRLVHYQCAVRRDEWERIREEFLEAFLVQKRAYRRANGGSCAPCLAIDAEPRFAPDDRRVEVASQIKSRQQKPSQHKTVVRRTFIEVAEDDSTEDEFVIIRERSNRRAKTFPSRWPPSSDSE